MFYRTLNACKNILVVSQVMDRPLCATVLSALYLEWGNPSCYVPVSRALTGDCIFRSVKSDPQGGGKKDETYVDGHKQEKVHGELVHLLHVRSS